MSELYKGWRIGKSRNASTRLKWHAKLGKSTLYASTVGGIREMVERANKSHAEWTARGGDPRLLGNNPDRSSRSIEVYGFKGIEDKPLASRGLNSYRYKGHYGWIMIGAKDNSDALREANRSLSHGKATLKNLQRWNGTRYVPVSSASNPRGCGCRKRYVRRNTRHRKMYVIQLKSGSLLKGGSAAEVFHAIAEARKAARKHHGRVGHWNWVSGKFSPISGEGYRSNPRRRYYKRGRK